MLAQKSIAELETPPLVAGATPMACFSPDGQKLVIAAFANSPRGGRVLTFVGHDLKAGKKLATVEDPNASGTVTLAIADDATLVAASSTGRIWTVDYANGQIGDDFETLVAKGETPISGPIAISPDRKRFAIGVIGEPFTTYGVRVYDLEARKALRTVIGHAGPVSTIHFSPDGTALLSGAQDTSVITWDLAKLAKEK